MRILILHSRYLSGPVSGENRVVADERSLLEHGHHEVTVWDPEPVAEGVRDRLTLARDAIWSRSAEAKVRSLLRETRPDVVHFHNLFPNLSPAVLRVTDEEGVPSLGTLHNFRYLCLPSTFLRDGGPCEACLNRIPWRGVVHRCYRGSALGSAALATSLIVHRATHSLERTTLFLAASTFIRQKYIEAGWDPEKIAVKSNFCWPTAKRDGVGEYFLFVGRLSEEKGLPTLLEAWRRVDAPLVVVGAGPMEDQLRALAPANARLVGGVEPDEVGRWMAGARALVLPSECYEGQPRAVLEAYAAGVPVIASDIGGLPEVVDQGRTGLLARPGDPESLALAASALLDDELAERLGAGAYERWRLRFAPEPALAALEECYRTAISSVAR